MRKYNILAEYNKAVNDLGKLNDKISNLQREKDYKVSKIEKDFEQQITIALNEKEQLEAMICYIKGIIKK